MSKSKVPATIDAEAQVVQQLPAVVQQTPTDLDRKGKEVADLCKQIVIKTALKIDKNQYVRVEGWQSIATTYGCVASSRNVQADYAPDGKLLGYKAIGEVRSMATGQIVGEAEGYVGVDEPAWFGGIQRKFDKYAKRWVDKELPKRPDYAIRAMTQTRAISRACRAAFAFVVTLMDVEGLKTTPAEEVPDGGFQDNAPAPPAAPSSSNAAPKPAQGKTAWEQKQSQNDRPSGAKTREEAQGELKGWRAVKLTSSKNKGKALGELSEKTLQWYIENWDFDQNTGERKNTPVRKALNEAEAEFSGGEGSQPDPASEQDWEKAEREAKDKTRREVAKVAPKDNDNDSDAAGSSQQDDDEVPF